MATRRNKKTREREKEMARSISNLPAIEQFSIDETTNLDWKWEYWLEDFEIYIAATGVTDVKQKKALLLHLVGKDVKDIYKTLKPKEGENEDTYKTVCENLNGHYKPKNNITYERYIFKEEKRNQDENTAAYITWLRQLAETAIFTI